MSFSEWIDHTLTRAPREKMPAGLVKGSEAWKKEKKERRKDNGTVDPGDGPSPLMARLDRAQLLLRVLRGITRREKQQQKQSMKKSLKLSLKKSLKKSSCH